jgi:hypothetical protein
MSGAILQQPMYVRGRDNDIVLLDAYDRHT